MYEQKSGATVGSHMIELESASSGLAGTSDEESEGSQIQCVENGTF